MSPQFAFGSKTPPSGTSRLVVITLLAVVVGGCEAPTAPGEAVVALEVDPNVVRTIHPIPQTGSTGEAPTETRLPLSEIDCLQADPRTCTVRDRLRVTIHNQGGAPLELETYCSRFLDRFSSDAWHWVQGDVCAIAGWPPPPEVIPPGASLQATVPADRMAAGRYRVRIHLAPVGSGAFGAPMTSDPFELTPLPDVHPFSCPDQAAGERAAQYAEEQMGLALAGGRVAGGETEALMLRLEDQIPGFGGYHLAAGGAERVAVLTAEARAAGADSLVRQALGTGVRIQTGDFSFSQLVGWRLVLSDHAIAVPNPVHRGAVTTDVARNKVRFRVESALAREKVLCIQNGVGMPGEMLFVEESL